MKMLWIFLSLRRMHRGNTVDILTTPPYALWRCRGYSYLYAVCI
jgi:hypothetical protein